MTRHGMPDEQHAISELAADQFEKVAGAVSPDEQQFGGFAVRVEDGVEHRHVEGMRDVLDRASMLQRRTVDS